MDWLDRVQAMWGAFERPSAFGTQVVYQHATLGTLIINGIFNEIHNEIDPDTGVPVATQTPNLGVNLDDFSVPPTTKDTLVVHGRNYRVRRIDEDGEHLAELMLHEVPS